MRTSKQVIRDEAIYEVREEFEHNTQRMAAAIFDLREGFNASQKGTEHLANQVRTLQDEVAQRGTILAEQEEEIANHSLRAEEVKHLISTLQEKLLRSGDENLKLSEELSSALRTHLTFAQQTSIVLAKAQAAVDRVSILQRQVNALVKENNELAITINSKRKWPFPRVVARVADRFRISLPPATQSDF